MTDREMLIEVGRYVMGRNDGWRWWHPRHLKMLLDVWEPLIRAEERERIAQAIEALRSSEDWNLSAAYDAFTEAARIAREFGARPVDSEPEGA